MGGVEQRAIEAYRHHFGDEPDVVTRAPGRINLIGEHTDYNDGLVLPCAIGRHVAVAMGRGSGGFFSTDFGELRSAAGTSDGSWADYPRGVIWALGRGGQRIPPVQASFAGDVPRGTGLSSSAAIEAAMALAVDQLGGLGLARPDLALICCRAENEFVGVRSGIMDQFASLLCDAGHAVLIDCRTLESRAVPLDLTRAGLALLVCDTRAERRLAASGYNERRQACEDAARVLGLDSLRDATLSDLSRLTGDAQRRARHVVTENQRVQEAVDALEREDFPAFGRLMYASHASLRDDYDVSTPALDAFVETAEAEGTLGARLTGAGFGGCAIALVDEAASGALEAATRHAFARRGLGEPAFHRFYPDAGAEVLRQERDDLV